MLPYVTYGLITLMVGILVIYWTGFVTHLPCDQSIISNLSRNFIHVQLFHILSNLFFFYQIRNLELQLGMKSYALLILMLVVTQSLLEFGLQRFIDLGCSIGFSGILYGLIVWMLVNQPRADQKQLMTILVSIIASSLAMPNLSLSGHLIGFASGLIVAKFF
jgi:rhomboid protease GluP